MLVTRSDFNFGNILNDNIIHISGIDLLNENHLEKICNDADSFFTGKINIINCAGYDNTFPGRLAGVWAEWYVVGDE